MKLQKASNNSLIVNTGGICDTYSCSKKVNWIKLLLIEIALLEKKDQYVGIKVLKDSKGVEQIKANVVGQEEDTSNILTNNAFSLSFSNISSHSNIIKKNQSEIYCFGT